MLNLWREFYVLIDIPTQEYLYEHFGLIGSFLTLVGS